MCVRCLTANLFAYWLKLNFPGWLKVSARNRMWMRFLLAHASALSDWEREREPLRFVIYPRTSSGHSIRPTGQVSAKSCVWAARHAHINRNTHTWRPGSCCFRESAMRFSFCHFDTHTNAQTHKVSISRPPFPQTLSTEMGRPSQSAMTATNTRSCLCGRNRWMRVRGSEILWCGRCGRNVHVRCAGFASVFMFEYSYYFAH